MEIEVGKKYRHGLHAFIEVVCISADRKYAWVKFGDSFHTTYSMYTIENLFEEIPQPTFEEGKYYRRLSNNILHKCVHTSEDRGWLLFLNYAGEVSVGPREPHKYLATHWVESDKPWDI